MLLLHVFTSTGRSSICIPLDFINEPHLQEANCACTVQKALGFEGRTLIVEPPAATAGLPDHFVRQSLRFRRSPPSNEFRQKMQCRESLLLI